MPRGGFLRALPVAAVLASGTPAALANGFYIPVQDPFATARGNAFVATADRASAIYYNPAGLTQLDRMELHAGLYGINLGLEAKPDLRPGGGTVETDDQFNVVPQLYFTMPVNDRLVAGIGINSPFGLSTDWPLDSGFAPVATKTELKYATGWGVLGYEVNECFSIGGGIGVSYADGELQREVAPGTGAEFKFEGDDMQATWIVSALWRPHEQHSFGLTWRGWSEFDLDGKARIPTEVGVVRTDAELTNLVTPDTLVFGYAYKPNDCWTIETNIEWVNWERLNTSDLKTAFGTEEIPFEWDSNFMYGIGVSYEPDDHWVYSAGYIYIENSQPDETFNPAVADANRHWLSAGVGYQTDDWDVQFAYQYAFSDRDVSGAAIPLVNGEYDSEFHGFMLSGSMRF
jgi:long-chain fatty acid transport protein